MTFRILYVCTGNICRSPAAELLTRAWSHPTQDLRVGSAGTRAVVGEGVDGSTAAALARRGIETSRHHARQFEMFHAADADLVLTAESEHRDAVMTQFPQAFGRTFTLREFARLAHYLAPGRPTEVVAMAAAIRGVTTLDPRDDELTDPYRRDDAHAERTVAIIAEAVRDVLAVLNLGGGAATTAEEPTALTGLRPRPAPQTRPSPRSVGQRP